MMQDYGALVRQMMMHAEPVGDAIDARKRFFMGEVPGLPAIGPISGARGGGGRSPYSKGDMDRLMYDRAVENQTSVSIKNRINDLLTRGRAGKKLTPEEMSELRRLQTFEFNRRTGQVWEDAE